MLASAPGPVPSGLELTPTVRPTLSAQAASGADSGAAVTVLPRSLPVAVSTL